MTETHEFNTPTPVVVVFRTWLGPDPYVLALFPYEPFNDQLCTCYAHLGQHGSADYDYCISLTRPATPEEYMPLRRELESIGYALTIRTRANRRRA